MKTEKILNSIKELPGLRLQCILFEGPYPIAFTCTDNEEKVFFFICYQVTPEVIRYIASETSYETLIDMLKDKITLRDAFLAVSEKKYNIEFRGDYENIKVEYVKKDQLEPSILPTEGEYMEGEDDEFAEEIALFEEKIDYNQINYNFTGYLFHFAYVGKAIVFSGTNLGLAYSGYQELQIAEDLYHKKVRV